MDRNFPARHQNILFKFNIKNLVLVKIEQNIILSVQSEAHHMLFVDATSVHVYFANHFYSFLKILSRFKYHINLMKKRVHLILSAKFL